MGKEEEKKVGWECGGVKSPTLMQTKRLLQNAPAQIAKHLLQEMFSHLLPFEVGNTENDMSSLLLPRRYFSFVMFNIIWSTLSSSSKLQFNFVTFITYHHPSNNLFNNQGVDSYHLRKKKKKKKKKKRKEKKRKKKKKPYSISNSLIDLPCFQNSLFLFFLPRLLSSLLTSHGQTLVADWMSS